MSYLDAFIGDTNDEIFDELIMHLIDALDAETEEDRDMSVKMLSMGLKARIAAASSNSSEHCPPTAGQPTVLAFSYPHRSMDCSVLRTSMAKT